MKITEIKISVFEMTGVITPFDLVESGRAGHRRWRHQPRPPKQSHMHVLHVRTDEGLEGVCPGRRRPVHDHAGPDVGAAPHTRRG